MSYGLGVDLGTTYSAAAVSSWSTQASVDAGTQMVALGYAATIVPSAVYVSAAGEVLVGEAAVRRGVAEPDRLAREFKRRIGDSVPVLLGGSPFSAEALSARLLSCIVRKVVEQRGGPPDRLTLTHPANWGPFKRERLSQVIHLADLRAQGVTAEVLALTEPEAAAISYAAAERVPPGTVVAVYDLGGGTFDSTILRKTEQGFKVLGTPEGIERLGGIDVDEAVFQRVARSLGDVFEALPADDDATTRALVRLREECVQAKEALSSDTETSIPVVLPTVQTELRLTRAELEAMVRPVLDDTVAALRRTIASADLTPADVDRVLLVGGSSRMPLVAELVTGALGRPVFVDTHPKHAVALGAALWARTGARMPEPAAARPSPTPPAGPGPYDAVSPVEAAAATQATAPAAVPPAALPAAPALDSAAGRDRSRVAEPGPPPRDGRPRRRRWALLGAAAMALVLVAVLAVVLPRGDDDDGGTVGSGGRTETASSSGDGDDTAPAAGTGPGPAPAPRLDGPLVHQPGRPVPVAASPQGLAAVDGNFLWVASARGNEVSRINAAAGTVDLRIPLGGEPVAVLYAEGSLWVAQRSADSVARLDPANGRMLATIDARGKPIDLDAGAGSIWAVGSDGDVTRIDPDGNSSETVLSGIRALSAVVATDEKVWLPYGEDQVAVLDPESNQLADEGASTVGSDPDDAILTGTGLWVADRGEGRVSQVDRDSGAELRRVPVGVEPTALVAAPDGDSLWVVDNANGSVVQISMSTGQMLADQAVGTGPTGIALLGGTLWITLEGDDAVVPVGLAPA